MSRATGQSLRERPETAVEDEANLSVALSEELAKQGEVTSDEGADVLPLATARLLAEATRSRATDIHLDPHSCGLHVRLRIDGIMDERAHLAVKEGQQLVNQVKSVAGLNPVSAFAPEEGRRTYELEGRELDLRVAATSCIAGEKLAVRLLDSRRLHRRIGELGLGDDNLGEIERWLGNINGAFLVSGPTGSGKTTTLYALLDELKLLHRNIVTLEDPVEYQIDGINQLQVDESRGLTFSTGLKAMLRLDPDYLLLGEIRDAESGRAAIDAACSGRVLLSTLHSRDAAGAITSLRNWGLENQEICTALAVVVAQRLVRKLCTECRRKEAPTQEERRWLRALDLAVPEHVWHAGGCASCADLGFKERTGVFEVWRLDEGDYESILHNVDERTLRRHLAEKGHGFLLPDGLAKASAGVTTLCELRTMGGFGPTGATVPRTQK
ncbi:MAG: GspE/PulE family protein [Phycisphaerae bacterium]|jgi:type II secretory ATPase GspE/PulE/Tfp pilus assembly ATPase PilB-like protein